MSYLRLFPNTCFEYFGKDGCIYNLIKLKNFRISQEEAKVLNKLINENIMIESAREECGIIVDKIIGELQSSGMAYIFNSKVYSSEHKENSHVEIRGLLEEIPKIKNLYIECSNKCNYSCYFCNNNKSYIKNGCSTCIKWSAETENTIFNLKKIEIVDRALKLRVERITFSGGNPLIEWQATIKIIQYIRERNSQIEICVNYNGSYLINQVIEDCKKYDVILCIVLLGYDEESYSRITGSKDSYYDVVDSIQLCKNNHIEYEVSCLSETSNIEHIKKFINTMGLANIQVAEVATGKEHMKSVEDFEERKTSETQYFNRNHKYNSCLFGKIAITKDNNIQPCPMIKESLVDLNIKDFELAFQELKIDRYWRLTKDALKSCKNCSYKYLCEDCTAIELAIQNDNSIYYLLCENMKDHEVIEGGHNY